VFVSVFSIAALITSCDRKQPDEKSRTVTINNVEPRRDVTGEIIDAHDGCLQFFNGRYYLYGTAYGKTDGITNNDFRVYSSPDLERWTYEGALLKKRPDALYYRPYVVFNPNTRKYVLWYSWYPNSKDWFGRHGVATSDTPVGPFKIATPDVQLSHPGDGDGSLFVDDDGTGYFIYACINEGYTVYVERLTPDYLGATGKTSSVLAIGAEAPVLFRRKDLYYVLCGPRCAFCPEGSEVERLSFPFHPWVLFTKLRTSTVALKVAARPNGKTKLGLWIFPEGKLLFRLPTISLIRTMLPSYRRKKLGSQKFPPAETRPFFGWLTAGNPLRMASKAMIFSSGAHR
jgi:hypothetical protein